MHRHRGGLAGHRSRQDRDAKPARHQARQVRIVLECRRHVALAVRQRNPELGSVQAAAGADGMLRMGNALACRHQVDLPRPDYLLIAKAVAVQHFAFDHPGERLQADMRMRSDVQPAAIREIDRPRMVEEAPGADHAPLPVGQGTVDDQAFADLRRPRRDTLQHRLAGARRTVARQRRRGLRQGVAHDELLAAERRGDGETAQTIGGPVQTVGVHGRTPCSAGANARKHFPEL
ncbi:hypothetical protein D3C72_944700 [compost metagenome]